MADPVSTLSAPIRLFVCGDVMPGRGIDQILPFRCAPQLHEPYVRDAGRYVDLAEKTNGAIRRSAGFDYIWGDAIAVLNQSAPDARIINLETSITESNAHWPDKGIHYRMHPGNVACLSAAGIDCCVLANNHVMDWGYAGLEETLNTLKKAHIRTVGAGVNLKQAQAPAILDVASRGRIIVFAYGAVSSGIPEEWSARSGLAGVNLLTDFSRRTADQIAARVRRVKCPGDVVLFSIHWGRNWGYQISQECIDFAHMLIDLAGVDLLHGHSSHHPIGLEVYKRKLILYGCGDFLNDYEGIRGHENYRGDLTLMYFIDIDPGTGMLVELEMVPMQIKQFRLNRVQQTDAAWLQRALQDHSCKFNSRIECTPGQTLRIVLQEKN